MEAGRIDRRRLRPAQPVPTVLRGGPTSRLDARRCQCSCARVVLRRVRHEWWAAGRASQLRAEPDCLVGRACHQERLRELQILMANWMQAALV